MKTFKVTYPARGTATEGSSEICPTSCTTLEAFLNEKFGSAWADAEAAGVLVEDYAAPAPASDATSEVSTDATSEVSTDATSEVSTDATSEVSTDATSEVSTDAASEVSTDATSEVSADTVEQNSDAEATGEYVAQ